MNFLSELLSTLTQFFTGLLITIGVASAPIVVPLHTATNTPPISAQFEMEAIQESTSTAATAVAAEPIKKEVVKSPEPTKIEAVTPPPPPAEEAIPKPQNSLDDASEKARAVLVNIKCASEYSSIGKATGSGVIIDPKGIIVTNAHVAQYFMIEQEVRNTDCIVRTGSPARPAYEAKLIFLSPQWMARHALTFSQLWSAVNGDYDYAFLAITKSLNGEPLPKAFPYVPLGRDQVSVGDEVVIAGYAAELLDEEQIDSSLSSTIVLGSVKSVSAFSGTRADVLELGGNAAAQAGSSGGAILNAAGVLEGVLTLGSRQRNLDEREFSGISADYIRRTYEREDGRSLDGLLDADLRTSIAVFESRIPDLVESLLHNLNNPNMYYFVDE